MGPPPVLARTRHVDCGRLLAVVVLRAGPEEVYAMLGDRLGESSGKFTSIRVLPSEGHQVWLEVSFQGRGTVLGQEITDTGTYRQTFTRAASCTGRVTC